MLLTDGFPTLMVISLVPTSPFSIFVVGILMFVFHFVRRLYGSFNNTTCSVPVVFLCKSREVSALYAWSLSEASCYVNQYSFSQPHSEWCTPSMYRPFAKLSVYNVFHSSFMDYCFKRTGYRLGHPLESVEHHYIWLQWFFLCETFREKVWDGQRAVQMLFLSWYGFGQQRQVSFDEKFDYSN